MKIQNPFRLGLFGGLGVLTAVLIGTAVGSLATILTYVGAALFLALGLDPLVSWLENKGLRRGIAIVIVLAAILAVVAGLVLAIIPVLVEQVGALIEQIPALYEAMTQEQVIQDWWAQTIPWMPYEEVVGNVNTFINDNLQTIAGGTLSTVFGIASGAFGLIIVVILMLYFVASLASIKRAVYQLVPASKRERFIDLSEQVSQSVGRYVIGQVSLGVTNGIVSFALLNLYSLILGWAGVESAPIDYIPLFAFLAFTFSLIPLVGSLTGSTIITLTVFLLDGFPAVLVVGIHYLIYMQIEAYVISPLIMRRAVTVPGVVVVIAALAGGTLLGLLGALVAIPVAASILLIFREVIIPRQNEL